jgi:uncharacterized protein YegL
MKLDTTIKLSDVLKIVTAIVVVTAFVITDRMDVTSLRRDRENDHNILTDLSKGFAELSKWQSATDRRIGDDENYMEDKLQHGTRQIQSPKEKGEN